MTTTEIITVIALIFAAYGFLLFILWKYKLLQKYNISLYGPLMMWRTQKGRNFIDRIAAKQRFWRVFGSISIVLCIISMFIITLILLWTATVVPTIPRERAPTPEMLLGIPGINPLIPIGYGIVALVVAVVIHEFAHGVLARAAKIKLKSLGVLICIVPIGAFTEPDEDELKKTTRLKRARVFAVGPASNLIIGVLCAFVFASMLGGVQPKFPEGVMVSGYFPGSPAEDCGLKYGMEILAINGTTISDSAMTDRIPAPVPGEKLREMTVFYFGNIIKLTNITSGLVIVSVTAGSPAAKQNITSGEILYKVNNTLIRNYTDFGDVMSRTRPNQTIELVLLRKTDGKYVMKSSNLTLASKYDFYQHFAPEENRPEYKTMGFIGISVRYLGLSLTPIDRLPRRLANPFEGSSTLIQYVQGALFYISLPFLKLSPLQSPITDLYVPTGGWGLLPEKLFWSLANTFYWLFWINIMIGLTNVLPAVPLDGGYMFKDGMSKILTSNKKLNPEQIDRYSTYISYAMALIILALILWQLIGPRI